MTDDKKAPKADERADDESAKNDEAESPTDPVAASETSELAEALDERTADLKRVTAEYHNYRKRVERDRAASGEAGKASVVASLLPVLDDLDRARDHGDLVGPFASVADQLLNTLQKLGLEVFGEKGDAFDPEIHEAVAHMHSAEVTETSCIDVMRRGYRMGPRLLRAAMVAVAEPVGESAAEAPAPVIDGETVGTEQTEQDTGPAAETVDVDKSVDVEEVSGDIESEKTSKPNLNTDIPADEEALKAEIVQDAVETEPVNEESEDTDDSKSSSDSTSNEQSNDNKNNKKS